MASVNKGAAGLSPRGVIGESDHVRRRRVLDDAVLDKST